MKNPTISARSTGDGSDTLYSVQYGQTYHSTHGAQTEAEHVFLQGTRIKDLLQQDKAIRVLEVGFGTGLNFFLTAQLCYQTATPLEYVTLEKQLLSSDTLKCLNHHKLSPDVQPEFIVWLTAQESSVLPGRLKWSRSGITPLILTLLIGDATRVDIPGPEYDAIYHDPFSPAVNPELWTPAFFTRLYRLLVPGGRLATYSVKGEVRRTLKAIGFEVNKRPGPPGKREVLVAVRP
jgi:tRNA U34 5-methylaminomethyl-2-thiouridine-forming methyltransferase MnmC